MNKLEGFYKLQQLNLPTIPWQQFKEETELDGSVLWTIRCAVQHGDDMHLPRLVGARAKDAQTFAKGLLDQLKFNDLVIYYPYFIAKKSGVIQLSGFQTVIEAVEGDLWNLVTDNKQDVTIIFEDEDVRFVGNETFLEQEELLELVDYCVTLKKLMQQELAKGKTLFAEWSYAFASDVDQKPIGDQKLVFYEIRTV